jgi:hypothetical protein
VNHIDRRIPRDRGMDLALLDAILRDDFHSFIRKVFLTLNPGAQYRDNWHIRALAWHLEQVRLGRIKCLIITMPPRSLKSISASVAFSAFLHGKDPTKEIKKSCAPLTAKISLPSCKMTTAPFCTLLGTDALFLGLAFGPRKIPRAR